jgi:hypothetical protein
MKKDAAKALRAEAIAAGNRLSSKNRAKNYNGETFVLEKIIPLSEDTAAVIYKKPETGKSVVAFFYAMYLGSGGEWRNFIPTDSHLLGMTAIAPIKREIEGRNFDRNFEDDPIDTTPPPNDPEWLRKMGESAAPEGSPGEAYDKPDADEKPNDDIPF